MSDLTASLDPRGCVSGEYDNTSVGVNSYTLCLILMVLAVSPLGVHLAVRRALPAQLSRRPNII